MIPTLTWTDGSFEFPDLAVPFRLMNGYRACTTLLTMMESGEVEKSKAGVQRWINNGLQQSEIRRRQVVADDARALLGTHTISNALTAYQDAYERSISTDPAAKASLLIMMAISLDYPTATWSGVPDDLLPVLTKHQLPSG